jgi:hypothetical protein
MSRPAVARAEKFLGTKERFDSFRDGFAQARESRDYMLMAMDGICTAIFGIGSAWRSAAFIRAYNHEGVKVPVASSQEELNGAATALAHAVIKNSVAEPLQTP